MKRGRYVLIIFLVFFILIVATLTSFIYFEFKSKVYIKYCLYMGAGAVISALQKEGACNYEDLDTSSPILSNKNIDQLVISKDNLISIEDIPIIRE